MAEAKNGLDLFRVRILEDLLADLQVDIFLHRFLKNNENICTAILRASYKYAKNNMGDWKAFSFRFAMQGSVNYKWKTYVEHEAGGMQEKSFVTCSNRFVRENYEALLRDEEITSIIKNEANKMGHMPPLRYGEIEDISDNLFKLLLALLKMQD